MDTNRGRDWLPAEMKRMRAAVERGERMSLIGKRFACSERQVRRFAQDNGWTIPHAERSRPKKGRKVRNPYFPGGLKIEDDPNHEQRIYGALLPDVQWLRHRGWVITCERKGVRVGNRLMDVAEVQAIAARERRLAAPA